MVCGSNVIVRVVCGSNIIGGVVKHWPDSITILYELLQTKLLY